MSLNNKIFVPKDNVFLQDNFVFPLMIYIFKPKAFVYFYLSFNYIFPSVMAQSLKVGS
jgi:hypothetical protein